jgi:alkaline phosphatase D
MHTSRRLVTTGLVTGAVAAWSTPTLGERATAAATPPRTDPFTLGVASGDPAPDSVVLWTRLAVDPLADNGLGGMPTRTYAVGWQVASDEQFRRVVRAGTASATPDDAHSIHVGANGLSAGREYFYRFRLGRHVSPTGRTRTAPS